MKICLPIMKLWNLVFFLILACQQPATQVEEEERTPYQAVSKKNEEIKVQSLEVYPSRIILVAGGSVPLTVFANYSDGSRKEVTSEIQNIDFHDPTLARFDAADQDISALKIGESTFKITYQKVAVVHKFQVTASVFKNILIESKVTDFFVGQEVCFDGKLILSDFTTAGVTDALTWSSEQKDIAVLLVEPKKFGCFQLKSTGDVQIIAQYQGLEVKRKITVKEALLEQLLVSKNLVTMPLGLKSTITVQGVFSDQSSQDYSLIASWESLDPEIATVVVSGQTVEITAVAVGYTQIKVTKEQVSALMTVVVTDAKLTTISVSPENQNIPLGNKINLNATGTFSDGISWDITSVVLWSSNANAIASPSNADGSKGEVSTFTVGTAVITATLDDLSASTNVIVAPASLVSIALSPANINLPEGLNQNFTATGTYTNGTTQNITNTVSWSVTNPNGISVTNSENAKGLVQAITAGSYKVRATLGSFVSEADVIVSTAQLLSISFTNNAPSMRHGDTFNMVAKGTYTDGLPARTITNSVIWSTDYAAFGHSKVAWISNTTGERGKIYSFAQGKMLVKATLNNISHSVEIDVTEKEVVSVAITPSPAVINFGQNIQFTAMAIFTDGSTLNVTDTSSSTLYTTSWTSSGTALGTVVMNSGGVPGLVSPIVEAISTTNVSVITPWRTVGNSLSLTVQTPCGVDGKRVDLYCWYLGLEGDSCTETCANYGGYHLATKNFSGSAGTAVNCQEVMVAFGQLDTTISGSNANADGGTDGVGCVLKSPIVGAPYRIRYFTPDTTEESLKSDVRRACACKG